MGIHEGNLEISVNNFLQLMEQSLNIYFVTLGDKLSSCKVFDRLRFQQGHKGKWPCEKLTALMYSIPFVWVTFVLLSQAIFYNQIKLSTNFKDALMHVFCEGITSRKIWTLEYWSAVKIFTGVLQHGCGKDWIKGNVWVSRKVFKRKIKYTGLYSCYITVLSGANRLP